MFKQKITFLACAIMCITASHSSHAQQHNAVFANISDVVKAYYEYLPESYPAAGVRYPLIVFVHGFGERGPGTAETLPWVLRNGIPKLINDNTFPKSFTVNGQTFRCIIVSPQFGGTGFPSNNDVNAMINYAIAKYPVDINRIYLTGLSMGGATSWYYAGGSNFYSSRLAAIVPICGAVDESSLQQTRYADNIAATNLPVWATHNRSDGTIAVGRTDSMIKFINTRSNPPTPLAKKTIFDTGGHDAWTQTYNPNFRENGLNVYEWMLQYKRNFVVLPVSGLSFTARQINTSRRVELKWQTTAEANISGFKILRSTDGVNFSSIGFVNNTGVNGNGANYIFIDENPLTGKDFYKLEVDELSGNNTFSDVTTVEIKGYSNINIYPNPVNEVLNIQTNVSINNAALQIFNSNGQLIFTTNINGSGNIGIKLPVLSPGMYIAKIIERTDTQQIRFIKK